MAEVLAVHAEDMLIVTKQIADVADALAIAGSNGLDPLGGLALFNIGHAHALCLIGNHL